MVKKFSYITGINYDARRKCLELDILLFFILFTNMIYFLYMTLHFPLDNMKRKNKVVEALFLYLHKTQHKAFNF